MLLRIGEACNRAGDSAGFVTDERHSGNYVAFGVEVHVAAGGCWGFFAVVEKVGLAVFVADEHETAATDVSRCRVDDGQCEAHGYGSVDCVATLFQDCYTSVGGVVMDADDHGVWRASGFEVGLLGEKRGDSK